MEVGTLLIIYNMQMPLYTLKMTFLLHTLQTSRLILISKITFEKIVNVKLCFLMINLVHKVLRWVFFIIFKLISTL
jgi:hypothetical protein